MGNEYGAADLTPHLIYGLTVHHVQDMHTATGTFTIISGGYHAKMRLRHVWAMVTTAALNATEPIINIKHGGNEVVSTIDLTTTHGATAAIGVAAEFTIIDQYKDLEADDALQLEIETADGGSAHCMFWFEYELVE